MCVCVCVVRQYSPNDRSAVLETTEKGIIWGIALVPRDSHFSQSVSQSVSQATCARTEHTYTYTYALVCLSSSTQLPVILEWGPSAERVIVACQENSTSRDESVTQISTVSCVLHCAGLNDQLKTHLEDSFVPWQRRASSFKCIRTLNIYFKYEPTNFSKIITQCMHVYVCVLVCVSVCRVSP